MCDSLANSYELHWCVIEEPESDSDKQAWGPQGWEPEGGTVTDAVWRAWNKSNAKTWSWPYSTTRTFQELVLKSSESRLQRQDLQAVTVTAAQLESLRAETEFNRQTVQVASQHSGSCCF
jgi:hypothetical protein